MGLMASAEPAADNQGFEKVFREAANEAKEAEEAAERARQKSEQMMLRMQGRFG